MGLRLTGREVVVLLVIPTLVGLAGGLAAPTFEAMTAPEKEVTLMDAHELVSASATPDGVPKVTYGERIQNTGTVPLQDVTVVLQVFPTPVKGFRMVKPEAQGPPASAPVLIENGTVPSQIRYTFPLLNPGDVGTFWLSTEGRADVKSMVHEEGVEVVRGKRMTDETRLALLVAGLFVGALVIQAGVVLWLRRRERRRRAAAEEKRRFDA